MHARIALALALALSLFSAPLPHLDQHLHAQQELPPVSYICPMDADVLEEKPGSCPICKMDLIPARIDLAYSCITHPAVMRDTPGTCPLDRRELVRVNVEVHWSCPGDNTRHMEPGRCAEGVARKREVKVRAHGDHNPRHGGQFFMAADKWHHLEGAYPSAGLFRMYFYDNFTQPLDPRPFTGRVIVRDDANKEIGSFDLRPSRDGKTLDAQLKGVTLPARVTARVRFKKELDEQQFDFAFTEYTKDIPAPTPARPAPSTNTATSSTTAATAKPPAAAAPPPPAAPTPAPAQAPASDVPAPAPGQVAAGGSLELMPSTIQQEEVLPATAPELLALLSQRGQEAEALIKEGVFAQVYIPAMSGKNIALALENHIGTLPNRQRAQAAASLRRVVIAAWRLDMAGDIGNRDDLLAAYEVFAGAVNDTKAAYGTAR